MIRRVVHPVCLSWDSLTICGISVSLATARVDPDSATATLAWETAFPEQAGSWSGSGSITAFSIEDFGSTSH